MAARFQLKVFGSPQLIQGGRSPVRFRTRKHLAVLLYLHFEGRARSIPRDLLVDLLWPEVSAAKGRHSLSQALVAIRSRLGMDALTRREQDVQLLAELPSDLSTLREGGAPVTPLTEPLRGLDDCAGPEFAHWVDSARVRLEAQARDALRAALRAARARGNLSETHLLAAALYDVDPLCADAVYALAERALLDGDTVAAVRLLKVQVERAASELGTNPNPEIAQLLRRLERGDRPGFASHAPTLPERLTRREVFVGREGELARLEGIWDRARAGPFQTCLITGAPGIGKSSLIRRFATSLAARAWPVFVVSCQEIGQGIPYATVSELITALGRDPAAGGTDPIWLAEGSRVCPGLRAIYPGIPEAPNAPTDSIRLRVAEAVLRMMEAVADQGPVLLAFDDLQFLDPASREVLFLVTRRLERLPTLILAGARAGETEMGPDEAGRSGLVWQEPIELRPLDPPLAFKLIHDLSAESGQVGQEIRDTIARLAQGNPYHIEMLLADWRRHQANSLVAAETAGDTAPISWTPPADLRAAFARQYGGLSTDAQHVLQVLAVAGKAMATSEIASLLGVDAPVVNRAALEMLDRAIGRVEGGRLSFKNELHRAYVYYAMGEGNRAFHHSRLATGMLALSSEGFQQMLEASHHFVRAGMRAEGVKSAVAGSELALRRGAPGEARRALSSLLSRYPDETGSRVCLVLAEALVASGRFRDAIKTLAIWSPPDRLIVDQALATQLRAEALHRGRLAEDQAITRMSLRAVELAEAASAESTLVRALQVQAEVAAETGDLAALKDAGERAERVATNSQLPECKALGVITKGYAMLISGDLEQASAVFSTAAPRLAELSLLVELRRVLNGLGICRTGLAEVKDAEQVFQEAIRLTEHLGDDVARCNLLNNLGVAHHEGGMFRAAAETYSQAIELLAAPVTSRVAALLYANSARLSFELGDFAGAERFATLSEGAARDTGLWRLIASALLAAADYRLARGEPERAWPLVEEAISLTGKRGHLLDDAGQFARLGRHFLWATKGYAAALGFDPTEAPIGGYKRLLDAVQVEAFTAWMGYRERLPSDTGQVVRKLLSTGLLGALSRLIAVGVRFPELPEPRQGESSAQLVARVFPHSVPEDVPRSVGFPARGVEPSNSS